MTNMTYSLSRWKARTLGHRAHKFYQKKIGKHFLKYSGTASLRNFIRHINNERYRDAMRYSR